MSAESLIKATRQVPCSVVFITAKAGSKQDAMTASAMYVSELPPLILISVSKSFATYELIEKAKEFAINVASEEQVELAKKLGSLHGKDVDKFKALNLAMEPASKIKAPLIPGCSAYIECKVKASFSDIEGDHAIYVGEVLAYKLNSKAKPLVWLDNRYYQVGAACKI